MLKPFLLVAVVLAAASCTSATSPDAVASSSTSTTNVALTSLPPATTSTTTTTTTTTVPVPLELAAEPRPPRAAPEPAVVDGFSGEGAVTIAKGGAALYETPDAAEPFVVAREGLVFAAHSQDDEWIEVFTSCDAPAWLHSSEVLAEPAVAPATIGAGFDFSQAVIVLDPGHGGPWNTGAVSPSGLIEKEINLDIARRVGDLLREPHGVDWDTGQIFVGNEVSEAAWVMMTRAGDAVSADYEAGLVFRSDLANSIGANAMVAIHNNAGWEARLDGPGSDVYYQSQLAESRRFAKIMVAELRRSFRSFEADWVGSVETGAKSRLSAKDDNPQYYGILRRSEMPTVITEGAYMSNQTEADLLATPEFRQAYADAIYRALVRFLTTDDTSDAPDSDPVIWAGTTGSGDARPDCVIPSQN
jgi:N-acetylmuramoyl-L-alanine amidase